MSIQCTHWNGIWNVSKINEKTGLFNKNDLIYTIMIRQPDFVNIEIVEKAFEIVKSKKSNLFINDVFYEEIEDGLSVQILHKGSYDNEHESFAKMKTYITENNYRIKTLAHREIYLSDARKVDKDKLKTILRYKVEKI